MLVHGGGPGEGWPTLEILIVFGGALALAILLFFAIGVRRG